MPGESTTPDLLELARRPFEALNRREFDAVAGFYTPDAVLELREMGTSFEGVAAISEFYEDFVATFEQWEIALKEILDLGNGVTFGVYLQQGRPVASSGRVQMRAATVSVWAGGVVVRHMMYTDVDEGRAAAERLAEERG